MEEVDLQVAEYLTAWRQRDAHKASAIKGALEAQGVHMRHGPDGVAWRLGGAGASEAAAMRNQPHVVCIAGGHFPAGRAVGGVADQRA